MQLANAQALERYRELPVPSTTEEAWRFTDLRGFDPERFTSVTVSDTVTELSRAEVMLDLDVAALAVVTESGIEIQRAPEGIRFEPLTDAAARLYELVGWDDKFTAHNAALWQHGLL